MAVEASVVHVHEWTKTNEKEKGSTRWVCRCGESALSQRENGPVYVGPYGWTERELEAMYWAVEGLTQQEAGRAMGLRRGHHTGTYLKNARGRVAVRTTEELLKLYREAFPDVE